MEARSFSRRRRTLLDGHDLTDLGEHRLKDIEGAVAIFQLGDRRFPPLKTISNTNLPRPASSFVGRTAELADVLLPHRGRFAPGHAHRSGRLGQDPPCA